MGRAFEFRKERKFKRWNAMAKIFTKLSREITMSVKSGGPDPVSNYRLKIAIQNARGASMPKENIENAIKKATSKDAEVFNEVIYEGYGAHGVAIYVTAATNNPTRTVANVRVNFSKNGGQLGQSGSLSYIFDKKSMFRFPDKSYNLEDLELEFIDYGLEEIFEDEGEITMYAGFTDFDKMNKALEEKGIEVTSAEITYLANDFKELTDEQIADIEKLIDKLEEDEDVTNVYHNMK